MPIVALPEKRMVGRLVILALLITLPLTFWAVSWKRIPIETSLTQQARLALAQANLPVLNMHFEGRDALLTGLEKNDPKLAQILETVESVNGVRTATHYVTPQRLTSTATTTPNHVPKPSKTHPLESFDLSSVGFVYAQATITEPSFAALDGLADQLKQFSNAQIEIGVHTNNQGTALGQMAATQARAEAVMQYLMDKGIAAERLVARGYGATQPLPQVAPEDTSNRRIELTVLKE